MGKINLKKLKISGAAIASDTSVEYIHSEPTPTGMDLLDLILGGGFFPGRVYLLSGDKSSGKSTLLSHLMGGVQRNEAVVIHAESENTLDLDRVEALGANVDNLLISEGSIPILEDGFEFLKSSMLAVREAYPEAQVMLSWDTYQSTITRAQFDSTQGKGKVSELRKEMDQFAGGQQEEARIIKTKLKELVHLLNRNNSFLLLLSQVYANRDMYSGDKYTVSGGHGLHHQVAAHMQARKGSKIKHQNYSDVVIGNNVTITTVKNKQAPPEMKITLPLYYSTGYSQAKGMVDYLVDKRLINYGRGILSLEKPFGFPDVRLNLKTYFTQYYQGMEEYGFYHAMYCMMARFLAGIFPSITERFNKLADEREELIKPLVKSGDMLMSPVKAYKI